ncbi:CsiV family protein [Moritella viscosa]
MKKSLISLLVGLSVSSSFAVSAAEEERWFEVEVILFERNVNPAKVIEHWDQAVYPTYSKKNKDPMSLFINNDNLLTPNGDDNTNAHAFANDTITTGLQPTLIDDSDTLPIYGEDDSLQAVTKTDINSDIIKSTHVVIDGATPKTLPYKLCQQMSYN